ncbi:class I SAM-dependent methyltransferase [Streptomyces sp. NPDC005195]|uniref:class I SAM-dependent methyltransferase n=1 Tax=Streptomyces sp. NPDC005195 TaxID=3154561 RepID=UPI00339EC55A
MTHTLTAREREQGERFDAFYAARAASPLVAALYAEAMGDTYPHEAAPFSSCDWAVLAAMVSRLRLRPGQLLADIGCGTGGVGLWLARALNTQLIGVDVSATAVRLATERRAAFIPTDRARFHIGSLETTGLTDQSVHGLVCIDAFANADDHPAALREFHRILKPGGRAVMTRAIPHHDRHNLQQHTSAAGLTLEHTVNRPEEPAVWRRLYTLWLTRETDLRHELGHEQANNMIAEAQRMLPRLNTRQALVITLTRPLTTAAG